MWNLHRSASLKSHRNAFTLGGFAYGLRHDKPRIIPMPETRRNHHLQICRWGGNPVDPNCPRVEIRQRYNRSLNRHRSNHTGDREKTEKVRHPNEARKEKIEEIKSLHFWGNGKLGQSEGWLNRMIIKSNRVKWEAKSKYHKKVWAIFFKITYRYIDPELFNTPVDFH